MILNHATFEKQKGNNTACIAKDKNAYNADGDTITLKT